MIEVVSDGFDTFSLKAGRCLAKKTGKKFAATTFSSKIGKNLVIFIKVLE